MIVIVGGRFFREFTPGVGVDKEKNTMVFLF